MQDSCLGRGRNPLPSVGLLLAEIVESLQCFRFFYDYCLLCDILFVPTESALAQPLSSFSDLLFSGVAFALTERDFENGGARQIPDALAEMPEAQMLCLTHPPSSRTHSAPLDFCIRNTFSSFTNLLDFVFFF